MGLRLFKKHFFQTVEYVNKDKSKPKIYIPLALPKGSPLLPFFNHAYNKLRQNGAMARIKAKWEDKDNSLKCEANSLEPISIEKMGSLLVMLLSGMGLASIILILEKVCKTQGLKASIPVKSVTSELTISQIYRPLED